MLQKNFLLVISCIFFFNILVYLFLYLFHSAVPFNVFNYTYGATHFYQDPQVTGGQFDLLRSLGQYDAQWYLKLGQAGYPYHPQNANLNDKNTMDALSYAFFPFYPLVLFLFNTIFKNVEVTAFISSNLLLIIDAISLYVVITKLYSEKIAIRTVVLLFSFPFSIFYRSYFSEGFSLFFIIWFAYFFLKKRIVSAAFFLGLLSVTRSSALSLDILFLFFVLRDTLKGHISWARTVGAVILLILPLFFWLYYCYLQTNNLFYFYTIRDVWEKALPFLPDWSTHAPHIVKNILTVLVVFNLPFHFFHASQLEVITILVIGVLLLKSRTEMNAKLWWISFLIWLTPLFVTDTMSFTRYQIISFPLFLYLAQKLKNRAFYITAIIFSCLLFFVSLYFINWYWIG